MKRTNRTTVISLLLISLLVMMFIRPVRAASFTVTNLDNNGPGSLRQAILDANISPGDDVIDFSVSGTITLTSGQLSITGSDSLTINGGGNITISGNNAGRVFNIPGNTPVTLNDLTITDGNAGAGEDGGGIYSEGALTISDSTISGNSAGGDGGGIFSQGPLTLSGSTLSGNSAVDGGGLYSFAALMTITGSTISGNTAGDEGGGIFDFSNITAQCSGLYYQI
jgi:predicted outer membrane repeat protein